SVEILILGIPLGSPIWRKPERKHLLGIDDFHEAAPWSGSNPSRTPRRGWIEATGTAGSQPIPQAFFPGCVAAIGVSIAVIFVDAPRLTAGVNRFRDTDNKCENSQNAR